MDQQSLVSRATLVYQQFKDISKKLLASFVDGTDPEHLIDELLQKDKEIQELKQQEEHQQLVKKKKQLIKQIEEYDVKISSLVTELSRTADELSKMISEAKEYERIISVASEKAVDHKMLLSYAQRVAKYTLSPLDGNSWIIEPPIPQENHMRMSLLFQQNALDKENNLEPESQAETSIQVDLEMQVETHVDQPKEELLDLDF